MSQSSATTQSSLESDKFPNSPISSVSSVNDEKRIKQQQQQQPFLRRLSFVTNTTETFTLVPSAHDTNVTRRSSLYIRQRQHVTESLCKESLIQCKGFEFFHIVQHELHKGLQFVQHYPNQKIGLLVDALDFSKTCRISIIDDATSKRLYSIHSQEMFSPKHISIFDERTHHKYLLKKRKRRFCHLSSQIVDVYRKEQDDPRTIEQFKVFELHIDLFNAKINVIEPMLQAIVAHFQRVSAGPEKFFSERDRYCVRCYPKSDALLNVAFAICFDRMFMR